MSAVGRLKHQNRPNKLSGSARRCSGGEQIAGNKAVDNEQSGHVLDNEQSGRIADGSLDAPVVVLASTESVTVDALVVVLASTVTNHGHKSTSQIVVRTNHDETVAGAMIHDFRYGTSGEPQLYQM